MYLKAKTQQTLKFKKKKKERKDFRLTTTTDITVWIHEGHFQPAVHGLNMNTSPSSG